MTEAGIGARDIAPDERIVLADADSAARRTAEWLLERTLAAPGEPALCLAGGTTPRLVYALLARSPLRERFPWQRAHWFFGDERLAPRDSPRSNFRMVREAMFDQAPIPANHIHAVPTEIGDAEKVAESYQAALQNFYGSGQLLPDRAVFCATLLGVGADGHTASLFPKSPALAERRRWVTAVTGFAAEPRITLTLPVLESSDELAFLASGEAKRAIIARIARGEDLPAASVRPVGRLRWFLDRSAAGTIAP